MCHYLPWFEHFSYMPCTWRWHRWAYTFSNINYADITRARACLCGFVQQSATASLRYSIIFDYALVQKLYKDKCSTPLTIQIMYILYSFQFIGLAITWRVGEGIMCKCGRSSPPSKWGSRTEEQVHCDISSEQISKSNGILHQQYTFRDCQ